MRGVMPGTKTQRDSTSKSDSDETGPVSYKWDQPSDDQLDIKKGDEVVNVRWMERAQNDHLKFTAGLNQTIDLQTTLPMKVKWDKEEEGGNGGGAYYITELVSDNAVELCKKAVPTGEETGSKKNKAKARSFTVAELQLTVEQLNKKLEELGAPPVELPKAKSSMRKPAWVQLEGEVRSAYEAALQGPCNDTCNESIMKPQQQNRSQ